MSLLTKNNLYRLSGDFESPLPYPTPLEFATFIVDESKRIGIEYLDIHFRCEIFVFFFLLSFSQNERKIY